MTAFTHWTVGLPLLRIVVAVLHYIPNTVCVPWRYNNIIPSNLIQTARKLYLRSLVKSNEKYRFYNITAIILLWTGALHGPQRLKCKLIFSSWHTVVLIIKCTVLFISCVCACIHLYCVLALLTYFGIHDNGMFFNTFKI